MVRIPFVIFTALVAAVAGCGDASEAPEAVNVAPAPVTKTPEVAVLTGPRAEFLEVARRLQSSENPFVGTRRLEMLRQQADGAANLPPTQRVELAAQLSLEALRQGELDEAEAAVDAAFAAAGSPPPPFLHRLRGLVNLRRAEVENCIGRHNRDCCIFPLAGGGRHSLDEPARRARVEYEQYLAAFPQDLTVRWLLNLTAMAVGDYPDGVPAPYLIPPAAFASTHDIGRFVNVAPDLGVDTFNLAGGAVVDDFDGDGRLDIVTSTFDVEGSVTFYGNDGRGGFDDRTAGSGLDDQLGGLNCNAADYDNDGDLDVLVLRGAWLFDDGRIRNSLVRNDGPTDGRVTFTDVTRDAGIAEPAAPTQAATWGDFDNDGWLDLYVPNEARPEDPRGGNFGAQLFRNNRDGTFTDIAAAAGVVNNRYAKGAAAGDYDNDGDLDLYVSNIGGNRLYRNDGLRDGQVTFTDVAPSLGLTDPDRSFATWFFDYDNDGDLDLFVTAYEAPLAAVAADRLGLPYTARHPVLYRNDGPRNGSVTFSDVASSVGLDHPWLPMGASFGDLDNDGFLDIYLATGEPNFETLMPNEMLRNDGGRTFQNVTTSGGFGHLQKGHGVVFADLDDDGDQDIYEQLGGFFTGDRFRNALFENPGHGGRFLHVKLRGVQTNRSGLGARIAVTVATADGRSRTVHRAAGSVSSFGGTPRRQEIGLGADATGIERVEVFWPVSGTRTVLTGADAPPLDTQIEIAEGAAGYVEIPLQPVNLGGDRATVSPLQARP